MESTITAEWLTVPEAAAQLGVNPRTIKNWLADGRLQVRTINPSRNTRIHRGDWDGQIEKWVRQPVSV